VSTSFIKVFIRIVLCIYISAPKDIDILPRRIFVYPESRGLTQQIDSPEKGASALALISMVRFMVRSSFRGEVFMTALS
jgi:hypothetical protein